MNVFGYLEEVLLFFKELLCNSSLLSLLELCSMFTSCVLFPIENLPNYIRDIICLHSRSKTRIVTSDRQSQKDIRDS
jgi:ABC-type multidrug transport system permease subunit